MTYIESGTDKPWADAMIASVMVLLVTFVGIVLSVLTGCFKCLKQRHNLVHRILIPSFASGALLATCVFLLVPESLELLRQGSVEKMAEAHDEHRMLRRYLQEQTTNNNNSSSIETGEVHTDEDFTWMFGAALLGGFLFPILLHAVFPPPQLTCKECQQEEAGEMVEIIDLDRILDEENTIANAEDCHRCDSQHCDHDHQSLDGNPNNEVEEEEVIVSADASSPNDKQHTKTMTHESTINNVPLALSILVGDAFHNFTDGCFIGTSFMLCSRDIAYTLVATTMYHELAQELADFVVLTSHCGLPVWKALLANFLSGTTTLLGAIVILAAGDSMTASAMGIILAISAGVYINITACECIPKILASIQQQQQELLSSRRGRRGGAREICLFLLCFMIGCIPIGLVMISHGHCESTSSQPLEDLRNETQLL